MLSAVQLRTLDAPAAGVGKSRPVTSMAVSPVSEQLAVGYGDGSVCISFIYVYVSTFLIGAVSYGADSCMEYRVVGM